MLIKLFFMFIEISDINSMHCWYFVDNSLNFGILCQVLKNRVTFLQTVSNHSKFHAHYAVNQNFYF